MWWIPSCAKGTASRDRPVVLEAGSQFEAVMEFYRDTYKMHQKTADGVRHVVLVKVERALPLISPIYALGVTEDEVVARYTKLYGDLRPRRRGSLPSPDRPTRVAEPISQRER